MRFLVHVTAMPRARPPVRIFLAFAGLALVGFAAQRILAGGLSPAGVEAYYLGGGAGEALSPAALWEEVHSGAFAYGFVLFMLSSLLALCPIAPRLRNMLVAFAFVATIADLFAPFAIALEGAGGLLRVVTFVAAASSLAVLLVIVAIAFGRGGRDAHA